MQHELSAQGANTMVIIILPYEPGVYACRMTPV